ncbi:hypothetical protein CPHO_03660 [Corynebacterium phocae]|uniref:Glycosyl transferase family 1 domain-containing protein n=1 Tax=Corynebacterium phocae TaxID=161895 RepID=A0A1L7D202_9CORY|nr:glycosyltransferase [Corynebacterium phocae]APT92134.1 hypothetical protein CPHO_03660 [Corynebacterium phocae]KAA8726524.1 glycosyltransferase family 4 protein [Corynebacterium phocae]
MKRKLIVYPNCSKGGVTTVIRNRAAAEPNKQYVAVFHNDRGGRFAFDDLPNVQVRIIPPEKIESYLKGLISSYYFDEISILHLPRLANALIGVGRGKLTVEFHTSALGWIMSELEQLNVDEISEFVVPSPQMYQLLQESVEPRIVEKLVVRPNQLNNQIFASSGPADRLSAILGDGNKVPLVWIGRLEWLKGDVDFLRVAALLPENYVAVMMISLENDAAKIERLLNEVNALGLQDRFYFLMDLPQTEVAAILRAVRDAGGWFISTSYIESFGYAVFEALSTGLRVAGYRPKVPVWDHLSPEDGAFFGELGDIEELAKVVRLNSS